MKTAKLLGVVLVCAAFVSPFTLAGEQPPPQPPGPNDKTIIHVVGQANMAGCFEYILPTTPRVHIITTPDSTHYLVPPGNLQDGSYSSETIWVKEDDTKDKNWYRAASVPGKRVNAMIEGAYGIVVGGSPGKPSKPGDVPKPAEPQTWTTMSVDLDLDADTNRDGADNLADAQMDSLEDRDENGGKGEDSGRRGKEDNPVGAIVVVGKESRLLLRQLLPLSRPNGAVRLEQWSIPEKGRSSYLLSTPMVKLTRDKVSGGHIKGSEIATLPSSSGKADDLWAEVSDHDLPMMMTGLTPGQFTLVAHYYSSAAKLDITDKIRITVIDLDVVVDSDNDRAIDASKDNASEDKDEFLFWVSEKAAGGMRVRPTQINGLFELEDCAQVSLNFTTESLRGTFGCFVEFEPFKGEPTPRLNFYKRPGVDDCGYLKSRQEGDAMIWKERACSIPSALPLWSSYHNADKSGAYIFEAASAGAGKLRLVLKEWRQGKYCEIAADEACLRIVKIDSLFSKINMREASGESFKDNRPNKSGLQCVQEWEQTVGNTDITWNAAGGKWGRKNDRVLLYIHGYNVTDDQSKVWQKTLFKRLYWQGYSSPFVLVSWNGIEEAFGLDMAYYNRDVFNALQTGHELAAALPELVRFMSSEGKGKLVLMAHSLGNKVANEAILEAPAGMFERYLMCQGAVTSQAFRTTPISKIGAHQRLLENAQRYGYPDPRSSDVRRHIVDDLWEARWAANKYLHPGFLDAWWYAGQEVWCDGRRQTVDTQPEFVDYCVRWRLGTNNDPWGGYFAGNSAKTSVYNMYSEGDDVLTDQAAFCAWLANIVGYWRMIPPRRPDDGADDLDKEPGSLLRRDGAWPEGTHGADVFDEDLPEQRVYDSITRQTRRWAELAYYFTPLRMPAGYEAIGENNVTDVDCAGLGITSHSAMRANPYWQVWSFFEKVEKLVQP